MKKIFLIYGHYNDNSFNAAIKNTFTKAAEQKGHFVDSVDLYKALILGDTSFNIPLKSGDTIYVNPANKLVRVSGALNNTGVFELKDNEKFENLIIFAGGFSRLAKDKNEIILNRLVDGEYQSTNISIADFKDMNVNNGDAIYVAKYIKTNIQYSYLCTGRYSGSCFRRDVLWKW